MSTTHNTSPMLTISIITNGSRDSLWRCLDSLRSLTGQVSTELIVVDTGCDDAVLKRLRGYTSHIIPFKWCDDFAAARGAGLAEARGEWFMYLDDDEWILDAEPIVLFLSGDASRGAYAACYLIRNYYDDEHEHSDDMWVSRLVRMSVHPFFSGRIHEQLLSKNRALWADAVPLPAIVAHDGYVFASDEERRAHEERNISLLKKELARDPDDLRLIFHLAKEYLSAKDFAPIHELCERGLALTEGAIDQASRLFAGFFHCADVIALYYDGRYDDADAALKRALSDSRLTLYYTARLSLQGAMLTGLAYSDWAGCLSYCSRYMSIDGAIGSDLSEQYSEGASYLGGVFSAGNRAIASIFALAAAVELKGDSALITDIFNRLIIGDAPGSLIDGVLLPAILPWLSANGNRKIADTLAKHHPILSIELMTSGTRDTLWRSLDSLAPIADRLPCELIIVDTGCGEAVRKRLREYTERIVPFTWCDDFSAARNAGLSVAHGEWFMFLDDDEWFTDVDAIVSFFATGEYRDYINAAYIQRNYHNMEGTEYLDAWVGRMINMSIRPVFRDRIHEYMVAGDDVPEHNKGLKLLHSVVEHYGYVHTSKDDEKAHYERNVKLLTRMLKDDPSDLRSMSHLLREYLSAGYYDRAQELCERAIGVIDRSGAGNGAHDKRPDLGFFYCSLVESYYNRDMVPEMRQALQRAFDDKRLTEYFEARLCVYAAPIEYDAGELGSCVRHCERYLTIHEHIGADDAAQFAMGSYEFGDCFTLEKYNAINAFYIAAALRLEDDSVLLSRFDELTWDGPVGAANSHFLAPIIRAWLDYAPWREEYGRIRDTVTGV